MAASAVHLGKRIIGYPESSVPVVSVDDWASDFFRNPKRRVSCTPISHR